MKAIAILLFVLLVGMIVSVVHFCRLLRIRRGQAQKLSDLIANIQNYGSIFTIVLAVCSFILSFISVFVLASQIRNDRILFEMQKKEHQPLFEVGYNWYQDDSGFNETTEFYVINVGEPIKTKEVNVETYLMVEYSEERYGKIDTAYCKINNFFDCYLIERIEDTIAKGRLKGNNRFFYDLSVQQCLSYCQNHPSRWIACQLVSFYVIEYRDVYDEKGCVVFKDDEVCSMEELDRVRSNNLKYYQDSLFSIYNLSIDKIAQPLFHN